MSRSEAREQAVFEITTGEPIAVSRPKALEEIWASDVFTLMKMEYALSKPAFKAMKKTMETGAPLSADVADDVAAAMKTWALVERRELLCPRILSTDRRLCGKT